MAIGYALRKPSSVIEDSSSLLAMEPAPSSSCAGGMVGFQEASGNEESARLVYSQATRNETALQERLFGLYLVYTLYVTQPHRYVVQINITIEELEEIQRFLQHELIPERHYDAIAILQYLTARHIFRIVAFSKDFDVLLHHRYDRYIFDEGDEKKSREEQPSEQLNSLQAIRSEQLTAQVETIHK
ncbi:unnamed protein product, partial [Anisakis simplex]|uniref:PINc domain-containing protein n=1 Tax=Anisakis simplex TaxID=6269 RepID=A0A0M3JGA5_ANISI